MNYLLLALPLLPLFSHLHTIISVFFAIFLVQSTVFYKSIAFVLWMVFYDQFWLLDLSAKLDAAPSAGLQVVVMLVQLERNVINPVQIFVVDLPPETELEACIRQKKEEIASLSAKLHNLNFTESTRIAAFMACQVQPITTPAISNSFQTGFHFTPFSVQDQSSMPLFLPRFQATCNQVRPLWRCSLLQAALHSQFQLGGCKIKKAQQDNGAPSYPFCAWCPLQLCTALAPNLSFCREFPLLQGCTLMPGITSCLIFLIMSSVISWRLESSSVIPRLLHPHQCHMIICLPITILIMFVN